MQPGWPDPSELRVALGCMRLSTDEDADDERAVATIAAALDAGITVLDTARSYRDNERLVARALRACGAGGGVRVVTKGGMRRDGGAWIPDGRAKAIRSDCETSLAALDGVPIDVYLLHAPDPRTPWRTSVRALARLLAEGLVARVGVANVNRTQLDEALAIAPLSAVQIPLSPFDDRALRGGVVERCEELGITVMAHSPLGGPRRSAALRRREPFAAVAAARGSSPAEVAVAWLLSLSPAVVAVVGARRPEAARSAARAAALELRVDELEALSARRAAARPGAGGGGGEVVLVMGIPGAGKSRLAREYVGRGYVRLNRDERGGSLRELAASLDEALADGPGRVVLDNTYLTRASRNDVLEIAARHGARARCIWLDTPLAQAQVNMVERLLERFGALPEPDRLRQAARREEGLLAPTSQMRALRELEPPALDEGFAAVDRVAFVRAPSTRTRAGVFVAAAALRDPDWTYPPDAHRDGPHLVFDWRPGGDPEELAPLAERLAEVVTGRVETALCPHAGGAPSCWCRPPLPGLPLAFARAYGVDVARSTLVGTSSAHRTLAAALGARYRPYPSTEGEAAE